VEILWKPVDCRFTLAEELYRIPCLGPENTGPACVRTVQNGHYKQSKVMYNHSVFRCKIDRSNFNEGLTIGLVSSVLGVPISGVMAGVMGVA
jgi:hypothetical protein